MNAFAFLNVWQRARRSRAFKRYVEKLWGIPEGHPMWFFVYGVEMVASAPPVIRFSRTGYDAYKRAIANWNRVHRHT